MNIIQEESIVSAPNKSPEEITTLCQYFEAESARYLLCRDILRKLGERLSNSVTFSPSVYISISVKTREDLTVLMELSIKWDKEPTRSGINYSAKVQGQNILIQAEGGALPGTCKLIEEEYEIPAVEAQPAKPASIGKRMVLKCDQQEATS